eukprot:TRINITY_DN1676_c0_g2_i1.p1 TRINITY_DN1676_c0_g2~~TRINITY_DN1676_c0_g2_i1.p1  ORF type:complete len:334 (-),score=68.39 TRINITY_DN1676_c0_g2_i1:165-1046(-)
MSIPTSSIRRQLTSLCFSEEFSDISVSVEGKLLSAHSLLLQIRSPVFKSLIEAARKNQISFIKITEFSCETIKAILNWLYTDSIRYSSQKEVLMKAAQYFQLTDLCNILCGKQPKSSIVDCLSGLVGSKDFSDIHFQVGGGEIVHAHSLVLAMRSLHFKRLLSWSNKETSTRLVKMTDLSKAELMLILCFLYTDHVDLTPENAVSTLENSNFFQLERLKALCEEFWHDHISPENASEILAMAEQYQAHQLLAFSHQYIFSHIRQVVETESFKNLDQTIVSNLLVAAVELSKNE